MVRRRGNYEGRDLPPLQSKHIYIVYILAKRHVINIDIERFAITKNR